MLKGQTKLLQPEEESPLLQARTAMKSIEGWRPYHVKHSLKQAEFNTEEPSPPGRIHDLIDQKWDRHFFFHCSITEINEADTF